VTLALRRLAQIAPDEARPLILREILNPRRGATLKTLGSLRDAELPELDDALAANFEAGNSEIHAALVQRYATKKVAPRILASAGDKIGAMACSGVSTSLTSPTSNSRNTALDRSQHSGRSFRSIHGEPPLFFSEARTRRATSLAR
jgi:hypothetical protein